MSHVAHTITFQEDFNGELLLEEGSVSIGRGVAQAQPYGLLCGALASCLYATFLPILAKKRATIQGCTIKVEGEKREETPTMFNEVHLIIEIHGSNDDQAVIKSMDLACKYCSVYNTIAAVSKMSYEIQFI